MGEGANRIGDLSFGLLDRSGAEREANAAAMANAREQAETLAAAAGVKLGRIQEIKPVSRAERSVTGAPHLGPAGRRDRHPARTRQP